MKLPLRARNMIKTVLWLSHAKLVYARITLTRYTSLYFLFTLFFFLVLSALQGVILNDNTKAVNILQDIVDSAELPPHLTRVVESTLEVCNGIPNQDATVCSPVIDMTEGSAALQRRKREIYSRIYRRQIAPVDPDADDEGESSADEDGVESVSSDDDSISSDEGEGVEGEDDDDEAEENDDEDDSPVPILTSASATATVTATISSPSGTLTSGLPAGQTSSVATRPVSSSPAGPPPPVSSPPPLPTVVTNNQGGQQIPSNQQSSSSLDESCLYALSWLEDGLHDAQREDVAILFSQIWMMTLGVVAILNESLPHLGAAFLAHLLEGAWAASRIQSTKTLIGLYRNIIVPGPCNNRDFLGTWWEERLTHTIPVVALNVLAVFTLGFLSWKLYRIYSVQTFSRVGASPKVHSMYKLLLFFSVGLQLSSFFSVTSAAMWINKMTHGNFMIFAKHWKIYTAVFAIFLILILPWVILGWKCMRKECRRQVAAFFVISLLLIVMTTVMFASLMYRTIFMRWEFFATVTVTSFIFLVVTVALGIACRVNFGKGLSNYLDVSEALEGADFTPVHFEKRDYYYDDGQWDTEKSFASPAPVPDLAPPEKAYYSPPTNVMSASVEDDPFMSPQELRITKGASIYSNNTKSPLYMSSSPPIVSGISDYDVNAAGVSTDDSSRRASLRRNSTTYTNGGVVEKSRWSEFSDSTKRSSGLLPPVLPIPDGPEYLRYPSVISQFEHPKLWVANPDMMRNSTVSSVVVPGVLPPVPIPTAPLPPPSAFPAAAVAPAVAIPAVNPFGTEADSPLRRSPSNASTSTNGSGRGMVSPFPTVPRRPGSSGSTGAKA